MRRIESRIDTRSAQFRAWSAAARERVAELNERQRDAREVRPERDVQRLEHLLDGIVTSCNPLGSLWTQTNLAAIVPIPAKEQ